MRKPTGSIQQRSASGFRIRWVDGAGIRQAESIKGTRQEAERLLKLRLSGVVRPDPSDCSPKHYAFKKLHAAGYGFPGVYFLCSKANGLVKIGHAKDAGKRLGALVAQSSVKLDLVAFIPSFYHLEAERCIHVFLESKRTHGEWFKITAADIEAALRHWARWSPEFLLKATDHAFLSSRGLEAIL